MSYNVLFFQMFIALSMAPLEGEEASLQRPLAEFLEDPAGGSGSGGGRPRKSLVRSSDLE